MRADRRRAQLKMAEQILRDNPDRRMTARDIFSEMEKRNQNLVPRNATGLGLVLRSIRPPVVAEWYNGRRFYFLEGAE